MLARRAAPQLQAARAGRRVRRRRSLPGSWLLTAAVVAALALGFRGWAAFVSPGGRAASRSPRSGWRGRGPSRVPAGAAEDEAETAGAEVLAGATEDEADTAKAESKATSRGERGENHPVNKLLTVVQKTLGRTATKDDIVYTYFERVGGGKGSREMKEVAQVQLNCFEGEPVFMGEARRSKKEAKKAAAEAVLADSDFLTKLILSDGKKAEGKKADGKKAEGKKAEGKKQRPKKKTKKASAETAAETKADEKPRIPVADLELGQEVSGLVKGGNTGGLYLDVGVSIDAYLPVAEMKEGFPKTPPFRNKQTVTGRVLWKEENLTRFWITRRPGDLERPPQVKLNYNASSFQGVPVTEWFEGKVVGMTFDDCKLEVTPPGGGSPVGGSLSKINFLEEFFDEAKVGATVRVRVKNLNSQNRLELTMLEEGGIKLAELEVGQTVQAKVRNRLGNRDSKIRGVFVEVGADGDCFLPVEEYRDGYPNPYEIKPGDSFDVRVLRKEDDRVWVTRRSGDLARPESRRFQNVDSVEHFQAVAKTDWLDGKVVRMIPPGQVFVSAKPPSGDEAIGLLNLRDTTESFTNEAYLGMPVKVRVKKVDVKGKRMVLSMRTLGEPETETDAATEAEEQRQEPTEAEAKQEEPKEEPKEESPAPSPAASSEAQAPEPAPTPAPAPKPDDGDLFAFLKR